MLATKRAPRGPCLSASAAAAELIGAATCAGEPAAEWWLSRASDIGHLLRRGHGRGGTADLLVIRGNGRDLLVVELLGDEGHRLRTALAEAALPHPQFELDVLCVLSGEVGNRRRNARAIRSVTII